MLKLTLCDVLEGEFVAIHTASKPGTEEYSRYLAEADLKSREGEEAQHGDSAGYLDLKQRHLDALEQVEAARRLPPDHETRQAAEELCAKLEKPRLERLLKIMRTRKRSALCFSGGGIRSATFGLGVLQGLSHHHLLRHFDYLSTVSGGGYIGSWLSAWRTRDSIADIEQALRNPPARKLDGETPEVEHLRSYSNYLSPQLGIFSVDTWTLAATVLRNMFLNWLILVPMLAVALLIPKLAWATTLALPQDPYLLGVLLALGAVTGVAAVYNIGVRLPSIGNRQCTQKEYLQWVLVPLCASAVFVNTFWVGWYRSGRTLQLSQYVLFGALLHFFGWIFISDARREFMTQRKEKKFAACAKMAATALITPRAASILGGAILTGALGGLIAWGVAGVPAFDPAHHAGRIVCGGFPMVLAIYFLATAVFIGLTSKTTFDDDREWWARSGGWLLIVSIGWAAVSSLAIGGPELIRALIRAHHTQFATAGGIAGLASGILGSLGGMSGKTDSGKDADRPPAMFSSQWFLNTALKLAPLAFLVVLLIAISELAEIVIREKIVSWLQTAVDFYQRVAWQSFHQDLTFPSGFQPDLRPFAMLLLMAAAAGLAGVMARFVNVNSFSLHAMYRSRLIRAYLGASNQDRKPNLFTGFDKHDNIHMHDLANGKPFHVVNMALNLVHGKRLAWQERKAESYTATRLHCGSARVGYQRSEHYGDSKGITLGTAMAISGAAASPNMGYHSSPLVAFLMTLFNARLGWWLANPGYSGEGLWKERGPRSALRSLISEALGQTDDENPYVYLSDGGHFENLALYEMILRRCDIIVAVDAGADPEYQFEDLANALRKIRVDLGVTIHFKKPLDMRVGPDEKNVHCAIGEICYHCADGSGAAKGTLIYIKPVLDLNLSVDLDQYHSVHLDFPQQPTSDQFFDESQFESYRRLGLETIDSICKQRQQMDLAQLVEEATGHVGEKSARAAC
ncbi:MAG TPA: patatin-like phospholipase family protein [Bryobacteraceae bacterium]|jgi:hypothetical protein